MGERESDRSRRSFLKAAVAVGGTAALSACLERFDDEEPIPTGTDDLSSLPTGQHEWNNALNRDEAGNVVLPEHHLLLYLSIRGDGSPTEDDRETVAAALETIERAYERSNRGAIAEIAYSPAYFNRFDTSLPESVDLPEPKTLSPIENPTFDTQDALLHLTSDRGEALLAIEAAMFGEAGDRPDALNGISVSDRLGEVFTVADRRTGFIGPGLPAANQDIDGIPDGDPVPEASPLFMGFKAGFIGNQASESAVAIEAGPFAGGTTKHVSRIRQELDKWYPENDYETMVARMFSPELADRGAVEGVGENLGETNGITPEVFDRIREHAEEYGLVGHAEKAARANRDENGEPLLLRRHIESTDGDVAALHFPSYQREISAFEQVREAMNGTDLTDMPQIQQRVNNGILRYIFTTHRGNFLVPPRSLRSLPTPTGD